MERVINMLFEIEEKANHIVERANQEKVTLHDGLEKDLVQMETEISEETNEKIRLLQLQIDKELKMEEQHLIDQSEKQLKDIELHYLKNHDTIVHKIVQNIIRI